MISDGDGPVAVFLQLGPDEGRGNNVVQATFDGATGMPAQFAASGLVAGNPAQTSVERSGSGQLEPADSGRDHAPAGALARDQRQRTDRCGPSSANRFARAVHADAGADWRLQADGGWNHAAAVGTKKYPTLEFDVTTVAGRSTSRRDADLFRRISIR